MVEPTDIDMGVVGLLRFHHIFYYFNPVIFLFQTNLSVQSIQLRVTQRIYNNKIINLSRMSDQITIVEQVENIPEDIVRIDNQYEVIEVLSNEYNSQGKVFLVKKGLKVFAAKIYKWQKDCKIQYDILSRIQDFTHVVKAQYRNNTALLQRQIGFNICLPVLALSYAPHGNLFQFIDGVFNFHKNKYRIPIPICKTLFYQLLLGLNQIHKRGIIHRDLKPQNLLLDENFMIKIVDFGFSAIHGQEILEKTRGTPGYKAPEVQINQAVLPQSDIFVCGIIFYNLCFFYSPFSSANPNNEEYKRFSHATSVNDLNMKWKSIQNRTKTEIPMEVKQFFIKVFQRDHKKRPTIQEILNSDLMKERASLEETKKQLEFQYSLFKAQDKKTERIKKLIQVLKETEQQLKKKVEKDVLMVKKESGEIGHRFKEGNEVSFSSLLKYYEGMDIQKTDLQKTDNIHEKIAFQSPPSFIIACLDFYLQTLNQTKSSIMFHFLENKSQHLSYVLSMSNNGTNIHIQCLIIDPKEDEPITVELFGKILHRELDGKILLSWTIGNQNYFLSSFLLSELKQAMVALCEYEVENKIVGNP